MAPSRDKRNDSGPRKDSSSENAIPKRQFHKPARNAAIPPQPTIQSHTIRLLVASAIGVVLMFALLMLAVQYAQRDWNRKNQRAKTWQTPKPAATNNAAEASEEPTGWKYELRPSATQRQMRRLAADSLVSNWWLILGRGLSDKTDPDLSMSCLRMAMAVEGENAEIKNDLGAAYLQQKRMKEAVAEFRAADQIRPGFALARFNLALCSIANREPLQAIWLLGQYLGQRPDDIAALRLQSTMLSQTDRSLDALHMLEKYLKNQSPEQPLFLEAAVLAARLGQQGNAIRYLETAMNGNPIQTVIRVYQSSAFRDVRLSGEDDKLAARLADKARAAFGTPVPTEDIQPLRAAPPEAKVR
jgi:tetratricopeptide (TPR) repeat protein